MRHRTLLRVVFMIALAVAMHSASAAEVVRFTDGRYLEVTSHEIHGEGIRLTLDRGGVIVLPLGQVEKIERGGLVVFRTDPDRPAPSDRREEEPEPAVAVARLEATEASDRAPRAAGRTTRR